MKKLFGLFAILLLVTCKSDDSEPIVAEQLIGEWEVVSATRNNRPAKSLDNSEFYISDSTFNTNFLPDTNDYPYTFDGKKLTVLTPKKTNYLVNFETGDTLILKTVIKNFDFKFVAVKKKSEADE